MAQGTTNRSTHDRSARSKARAIPRGTGPGGPRRSPPRGNRDKLDEKVVTELMDRGPNVASRFFDELAPLLDAAVQALRIDMERFENAQEGRLEYARVRRKSKARWLAKYKRLRKRYQDGAPVTVIDLFGDLVGARIVVSHRAERVFPYLYFETQWSLRVEQVELYDAVGESGAYTDPAIPGLLRLIETFRGEKTVVVSRPSGYSALQFTVRLSDLAPVEDLLPRGAAGEGLADLVRAIPMEIQLHSPLTAAFANLEHEAYEHRQQTGAAAIDRRLLAISRQLTAIDQQIDDLRSVPTPTPRESLERAVSAAQRRHVYFDTEHRKRLLQIHENLPTRPAADSAVDLYRAAREIYPDGFPRGFPRDPEEWCRLRVLVLDMGYIALHGDPQTKLDLAKGCESMWPGAQPGSKLLASWLFSFLLHVDLAFANRAATGDHGDLLDFFIDPLVPYRLAEAIDSEIGDPAQAAYMMGMCLQMFRESRDLTARCWREDRVLNEPHILRRLGELHFRCALTGCGCRSEQLRASGECTRQALASSPNCRLKRSVRMLERKLMLSNLVIACLYEAREDSGEAGADLRARLARRISDARVDFRDLREYPRSTQGTRRLVAEALLGYVEDDRPDEIRSLLTRARARETSLTMERVLADVEMLLGI